MHKTQFGRHLGSQTDAVRRPSGAEPEKRAAQGLRLWLPARGSRARSTRRTQRSAGRTATASPLRRPANEFGKERSAGLIHLDHFLRVPLDANIKWMIGARLNGLDDAIARLTTGHEIVSHPAQCLVMH